MTAVRLHLCPQCTSRVLSGLPMTGHDRFGEYESWHGAPFTLTGRHVDRRGTCPTCNVWHEGRFFVASVPSVSDDDARRYRRFVNDRFQRRQSAEWNRSYGTDQTSMPVSFLDFQEAF